MARAAALAGHLPPLYREGALIGGLTDLWGVQLDMLDEALLAVQRAHWFDATPDPAEAAALAALVDIAPEPFHADLDEFRAWVHASVDARLHAGAVTREALRILVDTYAQGFQRAADLTMVPPVGAWASEPGEAAALVENPHRLRGARLPSTGGWEPLARLTVTNRGIDPTPWAVVLTGLPGGSEFAPFVANLTTGHAMVFRGEVPTGSRLTLAPSAADRTRMKATLDGRDVTERLDCYPDLMVTQAGPGTPAGDRTAPLLARGDNELWFLPLAHYDTPGLDRFLLAFADLSLRTGRFDQTAYNASLFAQAPQVTALAAWVEKEPASLEVHLPARIVRAPEAGTAAALAARARLARGLEAAVDRTAAAGVATAVVLDAFAERQGGDARLVGVLPRTLRETGPTGADTLTDAGGLFDVTAYDDSVMR